MIFTKFTKFFLVILVIATSLYTYFNITNLSDSSMNSTISYKNLTFDKIAKTNIYIYGYQGDILTSRGVGFLDIDSNNIITVKHNIDKSGNSYYIYDSRNSQEDKNIIVNIKINFETYQSGNKNNTYDYSKTSQKITIDDIFRSNDQDLSIIYSQEYINSNVTSMGIHGNFYRITNNLANSGYIYLSGQVESGQSGSPVYCDDKEYICGLIVANNEIKNQVKILLINQKIINRIKK